MWIPYQTLEAVQTANTRMYQQGIALGLFATSDTQQYSDIIERNSVFYLAYESRQDWQQLYTSEEILSIVDLPQTSADYLIQNRKSRQYKFAQAIAYLEAEAELTSEQRKLIGQAVIAYESLYYWGTEQNNILIYLLNDATFISQFPFLTEEMINQLKSILV